MKKSYFIYLDNLKEHTLSYLKCLKLIESITVNGLLKLDALGYCVPPRLQAMLGDGHFERWLLQGAYSCQLPESDNEKHNSEKVVQTHNLISEFRQATTFRDDLGFMFESSFEKEADKFVNKKLLLTVNDLNYHCLNLQKKLKTLQKKNGDEDTIDIYLAELDGLQRQRRYISHMLAQKPSFDPKRIRELNRTQNVWSLDHSDRWMMYRYWLHHFIQKLKIEMSSIESQQRSEERRFSRTRDELDITLLKSANIVGMTTTSAARLRKVLQAVKPEIVIVEEAAEVLEAHIVAALTPSVKKVVLIGDHKQLKPSTAVYRLAKQYKLDVSLFERMINNGLAYQVLSTQHRMRPEIASLVVPAIYPDLLNAKEVYDRPHVVGVASNVFFVTHSHPEDQVPDSSSRRNSHEVDFIVALCQYLFRQGYNSTEITILATYAGQMTAFERERKSKQLPKDLRITTVDNYQGEENEIILLSLVRSNAEARIGFLSAENRVCVALTRAREGLYIIGNMNNLTQSSDIWPKIKTQLEKINAIGSALPLGCLKHPGSGSKAACSRDFNGVPRGGCHVRCRETLDCGHVCEAFCHTRDAEHSEEFSCSLPCERMTCEKHRCVKKCGEYCGEECAVVVEKLLPCGHFGNLMCSKDPEEHSCMELLNVQIIHCGHSVTKYCHETDPKCPELCTTELTCGHRCSKTCHIGRHTSQYECKFPVEKTFKCGHETVVPCCMSRRVTCEEPCTKIFQCGHSCKRKCSESCGQCETTVEKTVVGCGHQVMLKCSVAAVPSHCYQECEKQLTCGHRCTSACSVDCATVICQQEVLSDVELDCGHQNVYIPCHLNKPDLQGWSDKQLQLCKAPCRAELPCGHICAGHCGDCLQGRLHVPCVQKCGKTLACGHRCEESCSSECPVLCNQPCLYRCQHQPCSALCGELCPPCKKKCERGCKHRKCSRRCSHVCDISPCTEPCDQLLNCGHPCVGYCGEPCPQYCLVCSPDIFHSHDSNHRYVALDDCGHPVKDNLLKAWITLAVSNGQMVKCPVCSVSIIHNQRYRELMMKFYSNKTSLKENKRVKVKDFEKNMESKMTKLKYRYPLYLEKYGETAFYILEHLKKGPYTYKTSLWVETFFDKVTDIGLKFKPPWTDDEAFDLILERCNRVLNALSLRLKSMSDTDKSEILTEIYRLELASRNWPDHRDLLTSLKKYSLDELKAL